MKKFPQMESDSIEYSILPSQEQLYHPPLEYDKKYMYPSF